MYTDSKKYPDKESLIYLFIYILVFIYLFIYYFLLLLFFIYFYLFIGGVGIYVESTQYRSYDDFSALLVKEDLRCRALSQT
jgi:hypothetical protein